MDRILIVEDEGIVAMELEDRLRRLGFDVIGPAVTGEVALSLALSKRPDLILMDVRLRGDMDGIEAAARIKERLDIPFVFLTAYADEATVARMRPIEPYAYLIKPLEERSFSIAIHMALHRHRSAQARAQAERAQHRADARHKAVLDNTHDGIISVDAQYRIEVFNKGAERIFGYPADEILGEPLDTILPEGVAAVHRSHFEAFRATGTTSRPMGGSREVVGRRRSGAEFHAEVTISRLNLEGDEFFVACVRDISERRILEEQFIRAQKMEAVGRLSASVAHDFNNLLAALQANAYLLMCEVPSSLREPVQEIGAAIERGVALTRQLIGFSRQEPMHRQRLVVNEVVSHAAQLLHRMVRDGVRLRTKLDPEAGHVIVDGNLIEQVLMNLVVNARDALPKGGEIVIRTDAQTVGEGDSLPAGRYVRISVTDSGRGVPVELRERIFEPFFTTKPPGVGTGLGLPTVRTVARRSGGDVRLTHEPGGGCTFTVLLPKVDAEPRAARPSSSSFVTGGSETILLVEDDPAVLRGISNVLERDGYCVLEAQGSDVALSLAGRPEITFDILLTDIVMPGCSGRELARLMLERFPGLPVVFMTGFCESGDDTEPGFLDGHVLLQKPIVTSTLLRALRSRLDARPASKRSARAHERAD